MAGEGNVRGRPGSCPVPELVCPEHDEKFKLFCKTDKQLVCVICRDGEKHRGHEFQPVQEAAKLRKNELDTALTFLSLDNGELDEMTKQQESEMQKAKEKSKRLADEIGVQFEKMHEILRKREEEVMRELENKERNTTETMLKNLATMERRLMDRRETEVILQSAMDIAEPDFFLQWWIEKGSHLIEVLKKKNLSFLQQRKTTAYRSVAREHQVTPNFLSLGPYESHLQFCVWKEMEQFVTTVPECLTMKDDSDPSLKVSADGRSVWQADRKGGLMLWSIEGNRANAVSKERFQDGQHYWEVDVGGKLDWALGVKALGESNAAPSPKGEKQLLLMHDKGYIFRDGGVETPINLGVKPRKIGLYLDCERQQLCFYNADSMSLIHSSKCDVTEDLALCLSPGVYLGGRNVGPLTVCQY
ncbi:zinc-binding protein A33-like [Megalops cyprinoides]|uniref:zinc-binding protein A33-like n=1 Tax=Megalops cyprinoides TaxID=118141 RepID=UPI001863CABD|nr:zinc-binding protein A33-like [Megalops cyprinoides]